MPGFVKDSGLVTRCVGGETIIVPIRSDVADLNSIYALNEVGTRIWEILDQHPSASHLAEIVADEFEVSVDDAARDVGEFLENLESAGLIHSASETSTTGER